MKLKWLWLFLLLSISAFAQVAPLTSPRYQFLDRNGKPLAGGKVYSYTAGTSTPLATYADSTGLVQNANPLILDSGGFGNVWLGTSLYKITVKDSSDAQQWSVDNVGSYNSLLTGVNANVTGIFTSSSANPATTGALRLASGDCIYIRNTANSLDLKMICKNSSDLIVLGDTTGAQIPAWLDYVGQNPAPAVSGANQGRFYFDTTANQMELSENALPFYPLGKVLFATGVAGSAIANTVTETVAYAADTTHIPANTITKVGQILEVTYVGKYSTTATPTLATRFRLDTVGGTLILDAGTLTTQNNAANAGTYLSVSCVFSVIGAGGSMSCGGVGGMTGSGTASPSVIPAPTTVAFDTTAAHDFVPTEQWGTANASNTVAAQQLVEKKPN